MRERNTDLGEHIEVSVTIDFNIFAVPVHQTRQSMRQVEAQETANDNAVGVTFNNFLDPTFDSGEGVAEERYSGRTGKPQDPFKALSALELDVAEASCKLLLIGA
jgi:hypothetical protein